jgi:hypothetical protein
MDLCAFWLGRFPRAFDIFRPLQLKILVSHGPHPREAVQKGISVSTMKFKSSSGSCQLGWLGYKQSSLRDRGSCHATVDVDEASFVA